MAEWVNVKTAARILNKHENQFAVDKHNDKKHGWQRRFKLIDGLLYINVSEYRSKYQTNHLTREKMAELYFELSEIMGEKKLISQIAKKIKAKHRITVKFYFDAFIFKSRATAIRYYLALRTIKRELSCQQKNTTPSINAA